ncbi:MAG TPA: flagellar hook capping FlgD N-terminal domain-containing protein [Candidatus Cloacimonadota bacterium]|jgi:flagellar basal-body rod modification protein FlgD|nr:flagellar hook capping FlgD N-terminal domain-containing protein [Candidatus Cloacimonadales bacterium]HPY96332.1 flagellar hook capping FlgD N-terminal domain-containing protein [Candidatus Cloacimonadota bacterium]HQB40942.1 flagellar hook capping FlgD N-terminal domain-containing protein [Candidatus Cloacimonadota bacterium]
MSGELIGISDATRSAAAETMTNKSIMGKDEFLNLLTTQLKYQDPINPVSNEQFATQLAQFSQLETLQNINENIQSQIMVTQSMNNSYMISLIGKAVKSSGNSFTHKEGESSSMYFELPRDATELTVKVYDENGKQVALITNRGAKAGERAIAWDGKDLDGKKAKSGYYTFSVEAKDSYGTMTPETINYGIVQGVTYSGGIPYLMVNGQIISLSDIWTVEQYSNVAMTNLQGNQEGNDNGNQSSTQPKSGIVDEGLSKFMSRVIGQ